MFRKLKMKWLYKAKHFYTDKEKRFEFYYRKNWMDQFDVTVFDVERKTNRWFMITPPVFYTMIGLARKDDKDLIVFKNNIQKMPKPKLINEFLHNHHYTLIAHNVGRFAGETIVAKLGKFGAEDEREDVLLLKRVATVPKKDNIVLGMDTIELPIPGVKILVEDIANRYFKGVDLELEISEEEKDAVNKN